MEVSEETTSGGWWLLPILDRYQLGRSHQSFALPLSAFILLSLPKVGWVPEVPTYLTLP